MGRWADFWEKRRDAGWGKAGGAEGGNDTSVGGGTGGTGWSFGEGLGQKEAGQADRAGGRFGESRGTMGEGLGYYRDMIEGEGPSVAEEQMRAGSEANIRGQIQAQAAGRGGNMAASQQLAAGQAAGQGMEMNQQMAALRAQEQQAAMAGFSGVAGQMAGMDLEQQLGLGALGMEGRLGEQSNWVDYETEMARIREERQNNRRQFGLGIGKLALEGIGSGVMAGGMSDVRAKENIRPLDQATAGRGGGDYALPGAAAIQEQARRGMTGAAMTEDEVNALAANALGRVGAYEFDYKPGMGPGGRQVGPMAQDLAQEPALEGMVFQGQDGLGVDTDSASRTALAASANQERRIQELEEEERRKEEEIARLEGEARRSPAPASGGGGSSQALGLLMK